MLRVLTLNNGKIRFSIIAVALLMSLYYAFAFKLMEPDNYHHAGPLALLGWIILGLTCNAGLILATTAWATKHRLAATLCLFPSFFVSPKIFYLPDLWNNKIFKLLSHAFLPDLFLLFGIFVLSLLYSRELSDKNISSQI